MTWHGIGHIATNWAPALGNQQAGGPAATLSPGANWTGIAGSGFAAVPSDPVRQTAKPALRLITPPFQHFTDTLDVGVIAAANDGGSMFNNLGIAEVRFHYEGNTQSVGAPRWHTIMTQRGARAYFGWWIRLRKPAGRSGTGNLYVEAIARDAAMQPRVIGPFPFSPVDTLYDAWVSVAADLPEIAGVRYPTIDAALLHVNGLRAQNPLITINRPGFYDITQEGGTLAWTYSGYANITASVPGVTIGKPAYINDAAALLQSGRYKLHLFGSNLTLDYRNLLFVQGSTTDINQPHWLDGITMTSSDPEGRAALWRGTITPNLGLIVRGWSYLTECDISEINNAFTRQNLVRGCNIHRVAADMGSNARCLVFNTVSDHSNAPLNDELPAFTVHYTGAQATASLTRSGGQAAAGGGAWILKIGTSSFTFDTGQVENNEAYYLGTAGDGYWISDVVDWLNTFPDVTATLLLDQPRTAASCTLPGLASAGFTDQNIKSAPLTVYSVFNRHGDFYQHTSGVLENVIVAFNAGVDLEAQLIFLSPILANGVAAERDVFFFGNALGLSTQAGDIFDPSNATSQWGRDNVVGSHVVIAHNTLPNQRFGVRTVNPGFTGDSYCLFKNNVFEGFFYDAAGPLANLTVDGLQLHAGQPKPQNAVNVFIGGDESTLFASFAAGDFAPAGPLLTRGFRPAIPTDLTRTPFPPFAALGALAAEAPEYVPPPPSLRPLVDLIAAMSDARGQNAICRLSQASVVGGVFVAQDLTDNNRDLTQATQSRQPVISSAGGTFDSGDYVDLAIAGGTFTVILAYTKADASTSGTLISDQGNNVTVQYQNGSISTHLGNVLVNGNGTPNRDALHDALHQTGRRVVEIQSISMAGDTILRIGRSSGSLVGTIDWVVVIDETTFPANLDQIRALGRQVAALVS